MNLAIMSLREAVCNSANLSLAYRRHARRRGLWALGVPMTSVARAPVRAMLELAQDLRDGCYRPYPPRLIPIAKADGTRREIAIYMLRDRVAQRALLQVLQQLTDAAMSPLSFGFRPGRSVAAALACVRSYLDRGYAWVGDADVERCFDSIPRARLLQEVDRRVDGGAASALIAQYLGWDGPAALAGIGIPQGSGLAPWLCNVYLWCLDERMRDDCIPMVRYADDFLVLAPSRRGVERALALCAESLGELGLKLHPLKTRIVRALTPFRFLGQGLSATPRLGWAMAGGGR